MFPEIETEPELVPEHTVASFTTEPAVVGALTLMVVTVLFADEQAPLVTTALYCVVSARLV